MTLTSSYTSGWTSASANFGVMEMYSNNNDCANSACSSSTTSPGGDVATNFDNALGDLSETSYIPNPGNGTNQPGDTPPHIRRKHSRTCQDRDEFCQDPPNKADSGS